ncbi:tetratricopeptide repeat protein [Belnapia sp. T6]|uniref:Tetratricopeptide repeat protein n=1 Tax=Belnapia mucosa TaxID=2804532 RepID=A0ABS1UZ42_9PROT|nr:tetratricopeptide repeat protein [Belnapia mucosa]MBL6454726.1 tetratricopeptide repeat protein [Belnapia mucosa]
MADIFDEVEEDLRAERMRRLLARYGGLLTGLMLLVVAAVGAWQGWRWWESRQATQAAGSFLAVSTEAAAPGADAKAAADRFAAIAAEAPPGYRSLARLRAAALKAESGDRDGALALWEEIARDGSIEPLYRDLATLMWGLHSLDAGDPSAIESRLAPLASGPWRASVQEVRALAALKRGATEEAKTLLTPLTTDPAIPQGLRDRAGRLLAEIGS